MPIPTGYLSTPAFTSQLEVEALLSQLGVDLRLPDETSSSDLLAYYCSFATSEVLFYVQKYATQAQLAAVPWIRHLSTVGAALFLTGHGGEPFNDTLLRMWERIEEKLQMILANQADVPGLVTGESYGSGPVVANIRIDPQRGMIVRRWMPSSTDSPAGYAVPNDYLSMFRQYGWYW